MIEPVSLAEANSFYICRIYFYCRINLSVSCSICRSVIWTLICDTVIDVPHHLGNTLYRNTCLQNQSAEQKPFDAIAQRSTSATSQASSFEENNRFFFTHCIGKCLRIEKFPRFGESLRRWECLVIAFVSVLVIIFSFFVQIENICPPVGSSAIKIFTFVFCLAL